MSSKFFNKSAVSSDTSSFNYQPYIVELFTIMAGVLITSSSIIGAGMLIGTISEPSVAPFTAEPTNIHVLR
jgi:hypothetical protein